MALDQISTLIFAIAILHTFIAPFFNKLAHQYPEGSIQENLFHLLGEIEVVFGVWAAVFFMVMAWHTNLNESIAFVESLSFTEPLFVFVVMTVAGTYPIIRWARVLLMVPTRLAPLTFRPHFVLVLILSLGTLLGSFITEPAAMTLCALLIKDIFLSEGRSEKFLYTILGVLLVNISIGGTMTHFAAPPVVMVASTWGWDMGYVFSNIGIKFLESILLNSFLATVFLKKELSSIHLALHTGAHRHVPFWVFGLNLIFLGLVVFFSHHPVMFIAVFLFFLGVVKVTSEYQEQLALRQGLLVGFFLAGLVVLGKTQAWWLEPIITSLGTTTLFWAATALTAFTDNAALTYLGSQVPSLTESAKLALVAGAVTGGGLTVIANAPNPVGFAFLSSSFPNKSISALKLAAFASVPTLIAALFYLVF